VESAVLPAEEAAALVVVANLEAIAGQALHRQPRVEQHVVAERDGREEQSENKQVLPTSFLFLFFL
jgi:hypothetical protein